MASNGNGKPVLKDSRVDVKIKLSALWATLMVLYIYVDIFGFFKPGAIEAILDGKVWVFDITQTWALSSMVLMTIPSLMIILSLMLPARINRWTNIIIAVLYLVISVGNSVGETWVYMWFGSAVEAGILVLVVWYAVKWPRQGEPD